MRLRRTAALLPPLLAFGALGATKCNNNPPPAPPQPSLAKVDQPGFAEPHTPGSGVAGSELPAPPDVDRLVGSPVDLNTVTTFRTSFPKSDGSPPRAILILVPGFLGGGRTFDPLAEQLVRAFNGNLEVWAVDRRPNQLEDRLGGTHALTGVDDPACTASPPAASCTIFEGIQFYNPDTDNDPFVGFGGAAGPEDLDINLNGIIDDQLPLDDGMGARGPILYTQDDLRFFAHWGVDTYMRDWKLLVDEARSIVGPGGLVLLGGHSQGTTWAATFAAYDLDPGAGVDAGYASIDGLLLLEGPGIGPPRPTFGLTTAGTSVSTPRPTNDADYLAIVAQLEAMGGPDVFLGDFSGINLVSLGTSGEASAIAAFHQPTEPAVIQRTPTFGAGLVGTLIGLPAQNQTVVGLFIDDDFSPISFFRASVGFSQGVNVFQDLDGPGGFLQPAYIAIEFPPGSLRAWKQYDDPTLPTCPPGIETQSPGCAILDNGPEPALTDPPTTWGNEVEVTDLFGFTRTQFGIGNGFEWYFVAGRVSMDFSFGNDSSDIGDESLLAITQNANVDVPVLAIGGSNGLAPTVQSFDTYLGSIATPPADQEIVILEGYAHVDMINAANHAGLPAMVDWIDRLLQRKLLETF